MTDALDIAIVLFNVALRIALTVFAVHYLDRYFDVLNRVERMGLGLMGGSTFLTIPVVLDTYFGNRGTPFDLWASTIQTLGFVLYLYGRETRLNIHAKANDEQNAVARRYLADRGKL